MNSGVSLEQARAAKTEAARVFSTLLGPVAVGIVRLEPGRYGLKINLTAPPDEHVTLPDHVENVPVCIEVVGRVRKR